MYHAEDEGQGDRLMQRKMQQNQQPVPPQQEQRQGGQSSHSTRSQGNRQQYHPATHGDSGGALTMSASVVTKAARPNATGHAGVVKSSHFTITNQFVVEDDASGDNSAEGDLERRRRQLQTPPSNWEESETAAGSYFTLRRRQQQQQGMNDSNVDNNTNTLGDTNGAGGAFVPAAPQGLASTGRRHHAVPPLLNATNGSSSAPNIFGGTTSTTKSPTRLPQYQRHLAERQRQLDFITEARELQALEEERIGDYLRLEACKRQREVERLKLRQRAKKREELQQLACQTQTTTHASSHQHEDGEEQEQRHDDGDDDGYGGYDEFDASPQQLQQQGSITAGHRALLRDLPTASYLEYNHDRLTAAMRHRQACLQIRRARTSRRIQMEEFVGTDFAKSRHALQEQVARTGIASSNPMSAGVDAKAGGRCPTPRELIRGRAALEQAHRQQQQTAEEIESALQQMLVLDKAQHVVDREKEKAKSAGSKKPMRRLREIPLALDAPFKRARGGGGGSNGGKQHQQPSVVVK